MYAHSQKKSQWSAMTNFSVHFKIQPSLTNKGEIRKPKILPQTKNYPFVPLP